MSWADQPQVVLRKRPRGFSLQRWLLMAALIAAPAALCITTLWATRGEIATARDEFERTAVEVQLLRAETEALKEEIRGLREDRQVIERIAREQLHMLRPDEVIISFANGQKRERAERR
ncbi:MAG: septum formation initiator family protein [Acidobacteria bacterium]|nr:septum formation initiator family protein [Acidobacteriota bacterium]